MDESNTIYYKSPLLRIKYIIDTKDYCYQIKPYRNINGPCEPHDYSEANYIGDYDTRKSVTGYIVLINTAVTN